jgi:hypothetical protein
VRVRALAPAPVPGLVQAPVPGLAPERVTLSSSCRPMEPPHRTAPGAERTRSTPTLKGESFRSPSRIRGVRTNACAASCGWGFVAARPRCASPARLTPDILAPVLSTYPARREAECKRQQFGDILPQIAGFFLLSYPGRQPIYAISGPSRRPRSPTAAPHAVGGALVGALGAVPLGGRPAGARRLTRRSAPVRPKSARTTGSMR